ncbi:RNA 2'-phosphotransferase [Catenisphaera adipataccumulans]|uniref:Probable RNA 2'-phosphotransferase n=1 Tax=Catenisphaera adipataccumulans TaxID=700500 RepID=A0A7W8FWD3_9FIRM|nr:RNA 2'-phosphotransferase [Catenisphaera adipataccumulans]MBB5183131.1 putative RNA 2'-phosphotransferase [Catenisphaera adipataccumulans]
MSNKSTSKFISLILRHHPEIIGIVVDEHGWADVDALIRGVNKSRPLDRRTLEKIVAEDEKQRYAFNEDRTKIRAVYGHSIPVDLDLEPADPPAYLYHGTAERFVPSIEQEGLLPMQRLYVHLSADVKTAIQVGARHGKPFVYTIDAQAMQKDGYVFYHCTGGTWLTECVPPRYLLK